MDNFCYQKPYNTTIYTLQKLLLSLGERNRLALAKKIAKYTLSGYCDA